MSNKYKNVTHKKFEDNLWLVDTSEQKQFLTTKIYDLQNQLHNQWHYTYLETKFLHHKADRNALLPFLSQYLWNAFPPEISSKWTSSKIRFQNVWENLNKENSIGDKNEFDDDPFDCN